MSEAKNLFGRFVIWLRTPKCRHIWKTEEIEFLRSTSATWNAGNSVEIDYYDLYAHRQICINCGKERSIEHSALVSFPKQKAV